MSNKRSIEKYKHDRTNQYKRWTLLDLKEFVELRDVGIGVNDLANYFQRSRPSIISLCSKFSHLRKIGIPARAYAMLCWLNSPTKVVYDLTKENYTWKPYAGEELLDPNVKDE